MARDMWERRHKAWKKGEGRGHASDLKHDAPGTAPSAVGVLLQRGVPSVGIGGGVSSVGFGGRGGVGVLRREHEGGRDEVRARKTRQGAQALKEKMTREVGWGRERGREDDRKEERGE